MSRSPNTTEDCGCSHDGQAWVKLCEPHHAELARHKVAAQADYNRTVNRQHETLEDLL